MTPVELYDVQGALILRARGSELLILQHFIAELKTLEEPKAFAQFFLHTALVNRPARKLFEAWLRKDRTLWNRIFQKVHKEMEVSTEAKNAQSEMPAKASEEKPKTEKKAPEAKAEVAEKESAPAKSKATKKASKKTAAAKDSAEVKKKTTTKKKKASTTKTAEAAPKKKASASKKADTTAKKKTTGKKKSASSKKKS